MDKHGILVILTIINTLVTAIPLQSSGRITSGSDAPEGLYPYQISLRYVYSHICGGSIIHPEWVLTAASCVHNTLESLLTVVAGSNNLISGGSHYPVIATYIHEKYNSSTQNNDIAVLRVKRISFNTKTSSIALEYLDAPENIFATISGWGHTISPPTSFPDNLQHISVLTISNKVCSDKLKQSIEISQICTTSMRTGEAACTGDSGGPLVNIANGKLIGIVRGVHYPCGKGLPDVHSRISAYYLWVKEKCNCI